MSGTYQHLKPVEVLDPRVIVQNERAYAVLKGGNQVTLKQWTSTSISTSSIQFSVPPPSAAIFVDAKMYIYLPVRLTFTGTPPVGQTLIQALRDAPRAWPISSSINTLQCTINNQSVSINLADMIHCLKYFNTDDELLDGDYSMFPNYPDQTQQYGDLFGSNRSQFSQYADGIKGAVMQRGSYPFTVVANPVSAGVPVTAIIDVAFCEPIVLPPLYFGSSNRSAFFNVSSMDFNITFEGNVAARMWSHDDIGATNVITSSTATFGGMVSGPATAFLGGQLPLLLINYITPKEDMVLSPNMPISYPYFDVQRYVTQQSAVPAAGTTTIQSNNIQLSSIPRRIYIFVRDSNQFLFNNASLPDAFFQISNLSLQFLNKNGLLASASPMQLYNMAKKNHINMHWVDWSGQPLKQAATLTDNLAGIGSLLCIEFATDVGLDSISCPGKLEQAALQVQVTCKNISTRQITPSLYVIAVLEGEFVIPSLGRAMVNVGCISSQDILDAKQMPGYNYADVENVQGGDFFSGLKNFWQQRVLPAVRSFIKEKGISKSLGALGTVLPGPYGQVAKTASEVAKHYGYGDGGVLLGAARLPKKQLKKQVRHY